jgi:hypothetical protein
MRMRSRFFLGVACRFVYFTFPSSCASVYMLEANQLEALAVGVIPQPQTHRLGIVVAAMGADVQSEVMILGGTIPLVSLLPDRSHLIEMLAVEVE